jgi:adenosylcobinamide-phosphate guanylyltransferase
MCGGRGTRLDADCEKPLFEVGARAMVDRVCDVLCDATGVDCVHAAVSPATPATREHLRDRGDVAVVDTPGDGYVDDLDHALDAVGRPAVTATGDLPLLAVEHVERVLAVARSRGSDESNADAAGTRSVSVCVPVALKERLGASVDIAFDEVAPTGLNVVADGGDLMHTTYDARLAVNVNRLEDAALAEALEATDPVGSSGGGTR